MTRNPARNTLVLLVGIVLAIVGLVGTVRAATIDPPARAHFMKTRCEFDELAQRSGCFWNAKQQGNGVGKSFYTVTARLFDRDGHRAGRTSCIYYVNAKFAKGHNHCEVLPKHRGPVPGRAAKWSGDFCTNLDGLQTQANEGKTWEFRHPANPDPTDCRAL